MIQLTSFSYLGYSHPTVHLGFYLKSCPALFDFNLGLKIIPFTFLTAATTS